MKKLLYLIAAVVIFPIYSYGQCAAGIGLYGAACTAANAAMGNGAANATAFQKFKDGCPTTCALAVMAAVMVVQSLKTAKKAKGIEGDLSCASTNSCFNNGEGDGNGPGNNPNYNLDPNNPGDRALIEMERRLPEAERFIEAREREGYKIDPKRGTIKDPNGNSINSVGSAMDSGGLNAQQRAEAERSLAEAAAEGDGLFKRLEEYDEEMGGGGGSGGSGGGYNSADNKQPGSFGLIPKKPTDQSVSGLSVNHGDDSIGVAGDNIFEMIHRRYETKVPGMNVPNGP